MVTLNLTVLMYLTMTLTHNRQGDQTVSFAIDTDNFNDGFKINVAMTKPLSLGLAGNLHLCPPVRSETEVWL